METDVGTNVGTDVGTGVIMGPGALGLSQHAATVAWSPPEPPAAAPPSPRSQRRVVVAGVADRIREGSLSYFRPRDGKGAILGRLGVGGLSGAGGGGVLPGCGGCSAARRASGPRAGISVGGEPKPTGGAPKRARRESIPLGGLPVPSGRQSIPAGGTPAPAAKDRIPKRGLPPPASTGEALAVVRAVPVHGVGVSRLRPGPPLQPQPSLVTHHSPAQPLAIEQVSAPPEVARAHAGVGGGGDGGGGAVGVGVVGSVGALPTHTRELLPPLLDGASLGPGPEPTSSLSLGEHRCFLRLHFALGASPPPPPELPRPCASSQPHAESSQPQAESSQPQAYEEQASEPPRKRCAGVSSAQTSGGPWAGPGPGRADTEGGPGQEDVAMYTSLLRRVRVEQALWLTRFQQVHRPHCRIDPSALLTSSQPCRIRHLKQILTMDLRFRVLISHRLQNHNGHHAPPLRYCGYDAPPFFFVRFGAHPIPRSGIDARPPC